MWKLKEGVKFMLLHKKIIQFLPKLAFNSELFKNKKS